MDHIINLPDSEARIAVINNAIDSALGRMEELCKGPLGQTVDATSIKWGAQLVRGQALILEEVRKDVEKHCALLRDLGVRYNKDTEKLEADRKIAEEVTAAAKLSTIKFSRARDAVIAQQVIIGTSLNNIEASVGKVTTDIGIHIGTKVTDIIQRFEKLEVDTKLRRDGDLEMAGSDKKALQDSIANLSSVVVAKDNEFTGLRCRIESLERELIEKDLQLVKQREEMRYLNQNLDAAKASVQSKEHIINELNTTREGLTINISKREYQLKTLREETGKVLKATKDDHAMVISRLKTEIITKSENVRANMDQMTRKRDEAILRLEDAKKEYLKEKNDMNIKLKSASDQKKQFDDELARHSKKLDAAMENINKVVKEKAQLSVEYKNQLSQHLEMAESKERNLLNEKEIMARQVQIIDGVMKQLQNELDQLKKQKIQDKSDLLLFKTTNRELMNEIISAETARLNSNKFEEELRKEADALVLKLSENNVLTLNLKEQMQELHQAEEIAKDCKKKLAMLEFANEMPIKDSTKRKVQSLEGLVQLSRADVFKKRPRIDKNSIEKN